MLTLFEFEFKLFFHLQGVLTENYEFANMKTERKFNKTMLNSRDFMVYCFLVSKKDKKGKSYWSIRRMAEQCNMSYESVRRAIKSLEDQCLIDVEHCSVNGKKNSNIYTVHRLV